MQDITIKAPKGLFTLSNGTLVTEASDLSGVEKGIEFKLLNVINIINPRTGKSMAFMLSSFDKDEEDEIQGFRYIPIS